jgi:hypothetical protein
MVLRRQEAAPLEANRRQGKDHQYVFTAIDSTAKAIICYRIGKRDAANFNAFLWDLCERVLGRPELSSGGSNLSLRMASRASRG